MGTSIIGPAAQKRKPNLGKLSSTRTVTGFLRNVTSRLVYGRKFKGVPKAVLSKKKLAVRYNDRGYGETPPIVEFQRHQRGDDTMYFFGSDDPRDQYTLVMEDIDVLKSRHLGSPEGARKLAEHYKTLFPGTYFEPSTNGNGQHGYLLVEKEGYPACVVKRGLKNLQNYLRQQAEGSDVELVEVKGAPPVVRWAGRQISDLTYGTLAKVPRTASLDDLKDLPVIRLVDLLKDPKYASAKAPKSERSPGSADFAPIDRTALARLEIFAETYLPTDQRAGRGVVSSHDYAVALAILAWTKDHPNHNGTTPTKRVRSLWSVLVDEGIAERSFDPQRWKVIRDTLSDLGLLSVTDARYWWNANGKKGRAMVWEITDQFAGLLAELIAEPTSKPSVGDSKEGEEEELCTDWIETRWIETLYLGQKLVATWVDDPVPWWDGLILDRIAA